MDAKREVTNIDNKYSVDTQGKLFNTRTGLDLPKDEPRILFRAQDIATVPMLEAYHAECKRLGCPAEHLQSITERIQEFRMWQRANVHKVERPD